MSGRDVASGSSFLGGCLPFFKKHKPNAVTNPRLSNPATFTSNSTASPYLPFVVRTRSQGFMGASPSKAPQLP